MFCVCSKEIGLLNPDKVRFSHLNLLLIELRCVSTNLLLESRSLYCSVKLTLHKAQRKKHGGLSRFIRFYSLSQEGNTEKTPRIYTFQYLEPPNRLHLLSPLLLYSHAVELPTFTPSTSCLLLAVLILNTPC